MDELFQDKKENKKPPMIVLSGPTAVGKTKLSIALAKAVNGEIVSADSMQVYRHMDIGSAKITTEEMQGIPHHMIDILEPWEEFNVVIFKEKCQQCLSGIYQRGHIPIVTGGTGFYVQALLRDIDFGSGGETDGVTENSLSPDNGAYRARLEELAVEKGPEYLHEMLREVDPASAEAIHANNQKRVIRALEFFHLTGELISRHNEREREKEPAYNACYFVLNDRRERIYERIGQRVDEMLRQGLVAEVKHLQEMGCQRGMVSMQGLGYKEILSFLDGEISLEEAVETIKRDTRHFAKRQLTWFRREKDIIWLNKEAFGYDEERILGFILEEMRRKGFFVCAQEQKTFMSSIELRTISEDNFQQCLGLKASVEDESFVDSVMYSLAEAWVYYKDTRPFAIYDNDKMIGFVSLYVGEKNYQIINFLIDDAFHHKGLGTKAAKACISYLQREYNAVRVSAPVDLRNIAAQRFWEKLGFVFSDSIEDGYVFMRLYLT